MKKRFSKYLKTRIIDLISIRPLLFVNLVYLCICILICIIIPPKPINIPRDTTVSVTGKIKYIKSSSNSTEYLLEVKDCRINTNLNVYKNIGSSVRVYYTDKTNSIDYEPTDVVTVAGKFIPNKLPSNPGGFNSLNYYYGLDQRGYILATDMTITTKSHSISISKLAYYVSSHISRVIDVLYPRQIRGLVKGILIGQKSSVNKEIKNLYRDNGIIHILSISALHLTFIGMLFYQVLIKLKLNRILSTAITLLIVYFYITMCMMSVSMVRAFIMLAVRLIGNILGKTYDLLTSMSIAWTIILLGSPYRLYDNGFIFSFGAIFLIGYLGPRLLKSGFNNMLFFQFSMFPIVSSSYYVFPMYSLVSNFMVVGLLSIILVTSLLSVLVFEIDLKLALILADVVKIIFNYYEIVCRIIRKLPLSNLFVGSNEVAYYIAYIMILVLVIYWLYINQGDINYNEIKRKEKNKYNVFGFIRYINNKITKWQVRIRN